MSGHYAARGWVPGTPPPATAVTGRDAEREQLAAALTHANAQVPPDTTDFVRDLADALLPVVDRIANERAAAELEAAAFHCDLMFWRGEDEWRGKPDSHAKSTALGRNIAHRRDAIYLHGAAAALRASNGEGT